jgi:hypothetical protein
MIDEDTVKTLSSGMYRAHREGVWWVGDYRNHADAERALKIASSPGALNQQRGIYDGGVNSSEQQHINACTSIFGIVNCVTEDDIARTILPGEPYKFQGGMPVRA